jgi:hypothetical protein
MKKSLIEGYSASHRILNRYIRSWQAQN